MENLAHATQYWLCAGTIDSVGVPVYRTRTPINGYLYGDSLACLEWVWEQRVQLACNSASMQQTLTHGLIFVDDERRVTAITRSCNGLR